MFRYMAVESKLTADAYAVFDNVLKIEIAEFYDFYDASDNRTVDGMENAKKLAALLNNGGLNNAKSI